MVPTSPCSSAFPSERSCLGTCTGCCLGKAPSPSAPLGFVPAAEPQHHCSLTPNSSTPDTGPTWGGWDAFPVLQRVLGCSEPALATEVWEGWRQSPGTDSYGYKQGGDGLGKVGKGWVEKGRGRWEDGPGHPAKSRGAEGGERDLL